MEKPDKKYNREKLESLSLEEVKIIAKSLGLKTNTCKKGLIDNILADKEGKKIIKPKKKGNYLLDRGKYQADYDYLADLNFIDLDNNEEMEVLKFFKSANYIYKQYFNNGKSFKESLSKNRPKFQNIYMQYLIDINPITDKDFEEMMDNIVNKVTEDLDYIQEQEKKKKTGENIKENINIS
jgi:hypothetical protein